MSVVQESVISFDVEILDTSPEVLAAFQNAVKRALVAMGEEAETFAKENVLQAGRVDTGLMMNSIGHQEGDDYMVVGESVEYAIDHELGTRRGITPIHHLQRSISEHVDRYKTILQDSLENA